MMSDPPYNVNFERHKAQRSSEFISGSMALLHHLLWVFSDEAGSKNEQDYFNKKISDFSGYKKYVALGLLEASLSRVLILDERLYDAGDDLLKHWYNIDIHLVTNKNEEDSDANKTCLFWNGKTGVGEKLQCPAETLQNSNYDFISCHESMLEKLCVPLELSEICAGLDGTESGAEGTKSGTVITWLKGLLKNSENKGRLVIHTGRGKPDKILERKNKDYGPSELDDLRFVDFVNLRYAMMNGKYFLIQLLHNLRRNLDNE